MFATPYNDYSSHRLYNIVRRVKGVQWLTILSVLCIITVYCSTTYVHHDSRPTQLRGSINSQRTRVYANFVNTVTAVQSVLSDYPVVRTAYNELLAAQSTVLTSDKKDMLNQLVLQIHREKERRHETEEELADITAELDDVKSELQHYKRIVEDDEASHLPHAAPGDDAFYIYISASIGLVCLGAIMSGLQVGLFSIDPMKLALLKMDSESDPDDQRRAEALTPLLQRHHWLLVSLLIANALAMEALPIFLDALVPSYAAIALSVTLVLVFGEIIPQALCTKSPLAIGAMFAPMVKLLMFLTAPVSYPLAHLLDWLLGSEGGNYFLLRRGELNALVDLHAESFGGHLQVDQINLMKSALAYGDRKCEEVMTVMKDVYMLELHRQLDAETMHEIFNSGFSRIPVYDRNKPWFDNIVGLLIAKDLILLDPADSISVQTLLSLYPRPLERVFPDTTLRELLNIFKTGRTHMAIVNTVDDAQHNDKSVNKTVDPHYHNQGVITLEDVIEAILATEISDETDLEDITKDNNSRLSLSKYLRYQPPNAVGLSPQESSAVFYTFIHNVQVFQREHALLNDNGLKRVIADSQVLDVEIDQGVSYQNGENVSIMVNNQRVSSQDTNLADLPVEQGGKLLYQRGVANNYMTLVLDGFVEIRAGEEGYVSESHRWSTLGTGCMKIHDDELAEHVTVDQLSPFIPDFSAVIVTTSRLLRISRRRYIDEVRAQRKLPPIVDKSNNNSSSDDSNGTSFGPKNNQHIAIQIQPADGTDGNKSSSEQAQQRRVPARAQDRRGRRNAGGNEPAAPAAQPRNTNNLYNSSPPVTLNKSPSQHTNKSSQPHEPMSAKSPPDYAAAQLMRRSSSMDRVSRSPSRQQQQAGGGAKQVKFANMITDKLAQQRGAK